MVMLGVVTAFAQQLSSADPTDQETAKLVSRMIPRFHLSKKQIDDKTSSLLFDSFFQDLDPQKLYFQKGDIAKFEPLRTKLDDQVKDGNVQFAYDVFELYKQRIAEQTEVAHKWIDADHDFTVDEVIETDGKKLAWCETKEELNERWRKRIKYDLLQFKLDGQTPEESKKRLHSRYRNNNSLISKYDTGEELEVYLTSLANCFDPHSTYMSPYTWEDFEIQMKLSLDGIGAALRSEDGYTVVAEIVPGGAAAEDGRLKVEDRIIGVDQDGSGEFVDIFEMKLSEVVRMIRGPRGTVVRLQAKPKDNGELKVITLTRKKIELTESAVKGEIIDTGERLGRPGRIGVVSLPSFYRDLSGAQGGGEFKSAAADLEKVLQRFNRERVDAVIVDLRSNGGGALTEAIDVSGLFIDRGPVVQVKEPGGSVTPLEDKDPGAAYTGPLVVICNRLSASASEIFAGVIKDYHRGIIVGDTTTHGKGTVQNLIDVSAGQLFSIIRSTDLGKLKLTIQQFYRVNGDSTQNYGVRSDIVLPSKIDHWDLGEAFLDNALPFDQVPPVKYSEGSMASPEMISMIKENSQQRIAQNEEFQKLNQAIERQIARKDRTTLSLNEAEVRRERELDETLKKMTETEDDDLTATPKSGEPIFPKRYYEDEVLNITLDYIAALQGRFAKTSQAR